MILKLKTSHNFTLHLMFSNYNKHVGEISFKGQSLICAPNKIVVEIGDNKQLDCDWGVCIDE